MEAVSGIFVFACLSTFMPYYLEYYKDFEEPPWPQQDFYQAASENFGANITEEVFRSCSTYNLYCKEMFFTLPPTSPLFQSNTSVDDIERAKDSLITLEYLISVPHLLSVPADKFPKIPVRLLDP